uniref:hypothetical protein n=1 Tax=Rhodococcoides corynebacterioides TaxID=53972 RepID=UPI000A6F83AF
MRSFPVIVHPRNNERIKPVVDFADARQLAERAWRKSGICDQYRHLQRFTAAEAGREDREAYLVPVAHPAGHDASASDDPVVLVDKATGTVTYVDPTRPAGRRD